MIFEHTYHLLDLPTAHHRAGLAALHLLAQYVRPEDGRLETTCVEGGLHVLLDEEGLRALLNEVYKGVMVEVVSKAPIAGRDCLRQESREGKTYHIYGMIAPKGAFLEDMDPTPEKAWIKLWREMIFASVRTVKGARLPYERTAQGEEPLELKKIFTTLVKKPDHPLPMSGSWMIGCRERSVDGAMIKEAAVTQFLLHFWPFVVWAMVPRTFSVLHGMKTGGLLVGVPDVADLPLFCQRFWGRMKQRGTPLWGSLPEGAIADTPEELILPFLGTAPLDVFGVDVFNCEKGSQSMTIRSIQRIGIPDVRSPIHAIGEIKRRYWHPWFRKNVLQNILHDLPWWVGFQGITKALFFEKSWRHDTRVAFKTEEGPSLASVLRQALSAKMRHAMFKLLRGRTPGDPKEYWRRLCIEEYSSISDSHVDSYVRSLLPFRSDRHEIDLLDPQRSEEIRSIAVLALSSMF